MIFLGTELSQSRDYYNNSIWTSEKLEAHEERSKNSTISKKNKKQKTLYSIFQFQEHLYILFWKFN